ncbi:MAG: methylmalonyl Co-A mutase-associated GTPase MeaB [Calditrichaeota bacterium]|nr:MAG: methylmalonyl Co-A mutase-associated GTPase MeaB [Calditrichota bacterium]
MNYSDNLIDNLLKGDRRALARTISLVENENPEAASIMDALYKKIGHAYRIGVTGPPGAGKSTLVDELTKYYRKQNKTVGIIAVDPTSPFTGGALLGDRVRMSDVFLDEGVYIRSMATRGSLGGLSKKASDVADILDAFGKDYVIMETVGVGQSELDIVEAADTTVVVLVPESGDSVQAMKAGLMEIADLFVLNKADREGANRAMQEIQAILQLRENRDWKPKVVMSIASEGKGIAEIAQAIQEHREYLEKNQLLLKNRRERFLKKIQSIVRYQLEKEFWDENAKNFLKENLETFQDSRTSPYKLAEELLKNYKEKWREHHE